MRAALLLYITIIIFASCNNDENAAGGPCAYDEKIFPATLTRLEKIDSLHYDALFIIKDSSGLDGKDSIRYSILNNGYYITAEEVISDSLVIGKKYQYITQTIRSGSCNPNIDMLLLKPYAGK
jgi:hypothetical protein